MQANKKEILKKLETLLDLVSTVKDPVNPAEKDLHEYLIGIFTNVERSAKNFDLLMEYYNESIREGKIDRNFFETSKPQKPVNKDKIEDEALGLAVGLSNISTVNSLLGLTPLDTDDTVSRVVFNEDAIEDDLFDIDLAELL